MEKKYSKVKKLIKEFQQREVDFLHREEFYQQLLQEKDVEYNALVKVLKDRVSFYITNNISAVAVGRNNFLGMIPYNLQHTTRSYKRVGGGGKFCNILGHR